MEGINLSSTASLGPEGIWAGNSAEYIPPTDMAQLADALNWIRGDLRRIHLAFDNVALLSKTFDQITGEINNQTLKQSQAIQEAIKQFRTELGDQYRMMDQDIQQSRNQILETLETQRLALDVRLAAIQSEQSNQVAKLFILQEGHATLLRSDMSLVIGMVENIRTDLWPMLWASFKESVKQVFRRKPKP